MRTVKQRNMMNQEMKLAIGDELQTLFYQIANATKQAAEETRKELPPMKKTLTDIDGALVAQRVDARPPPSKNTDTTFGLYKKQDGQLSIGNKVARLGVNGKTLIVDDTEYKLTPGFLVLTTNKHPRAGQWYSNDSNKAYKSLVAQTKVKPFLNGCSATRYVEMEAYAQENGYTCRKDSRGRI